MAGEKVIAVLELKNASTSAVAIIVASVCATVLPGALLAQTASTPIKTSLCEMVKEPARFNGKIVQLRAIVNTGFEWSVLQDESCPNDTVHLEFGVTKNSIFGDAVAFAYIGSPGDVKYPASLQWQPKPPNPHITLRQDSQFRTLAIYLGKEENLKKTGCLHCPLYRVVATITGGFEVSDGRLKALRDADGTVRVPPNAFGHLNGWNMQVALESVSDVTATRIQGKKRQPCTLRVQSISATAHFTQFERIEKTATS
ncbi:MAG TPA: hypothetical protein VG456_02535 [Candidatus Sulfopaludibacter sp.]|jgi:hypothetical protein|nr:hypothetical protein [Candidatus Sulfopaludibacter sp.]